MLFGGTEVQERSAKTGNCRTPIEQTDQNQQGQICNFDEGGDNDRSGDESTVASYDPRGDMEEFETETTTIAYLDASVLDAAVAAEAAAPAPWNGDVSPGTRIADAAGIAGLDFTEGWSDVMGRLPVPRYQFAVARCGQDLIVVGGYSGASPCPLQLDLRDVQSSTASPPNTRVSQCVSTEHCSQPEFPSATLFDTTTKQWHRLPPLPREVVHGAAAATC